MSTVADKLMRRARPRQVCYLYRCLRMGCGQMQRRGSSAKRCERCGNAIARIKSIKGPVPAKLKLFSEAS